MDKVVELTKLISEAISASVAMESEIKKYILYLSTVNSSPEKFVAEFLDEIEEKPLPKAVGKSKLAELKKRIEEIDIGNGLNKSFAVDSGSFYKDIYIEESAKDYPLTKRILERFPNSEIHYINHYKDLFDARNQDFLSQKNNQALILAVNNGEKFYKGARTCQSFGNKNFYYTSLVKNCIYDCEYCYLQGMYPSGNMVVFVNIEDYFDELKKMLIDDSIYLSISYDTDLLAIEAMTGIVSQFIDFCRENDNLLVELRTKSGKTAWMEEDIPENFIYALTISPDQVVDLFEHRTAKKAERIEAAKKALGRGIKTRLCFDPVIPISEFEEKYGSLVDEVFRDADFKSLIDVSVGSFRISKDFIKRMQQVRLSPITAYPYEMRDGICSFPEKEIKRTVGFVKKKILEYIPEEKIYEW